MKFAKIKNHLVASKLTISKFNKPFKDIPNELFGNYCCDQTLQQLRSGALPRDVVLVVRASVVKDEFSGWVLIAMAKLQEKAFNMITAGWRKVDENMEACLQKETGPISRSCALRKDLD
ncbi:hypothetical protein P9112_001304 [Eukaryota sp. TZLM1-RC]